MTENGYQFVDSGTFEPKSGCGCGGGCSCSGGCESSCGCKGCKSIESSPSYDEAIVLAASGSSEFPSTHSYPYDYRTPSWWPGDWFDYNWSTWSTWSPFCLPGANSGPGRSPSGGGGGGAGGGGGDEGDPPI